MSKKVATRDGYGYELVKLGHENDRIVVVSADLEDSTRSKWFADEFPERAYTCGIAEQDMIGTAAGLALCGYTAFANSFAVFGTNRAYDQIRMDLCYNNLDVKVICSHAGLTVGEDGASAQCLEDIAIMRVLPNMKVICPVDTIETAKATRAIANTFGPAYLRTSRAALPIITTEDDVFEIGKANIVRDGSDVSIIACGIMVSEALEAAKTLAKEGINARVINMHTIKPIDEACIIKAAKETGAIVTAEEHQMAGGLGSAVAEVVVANAPVPMEIIGTRDTFGETGAPDQLMTIYGLKAVNIVEAARKVVKKKSKNVQLVQ